MFVPRPNQSVPAGCLVGFMALFPAIACGLGCWGLIKWAFLPVEYRSFDDRFWIVAITAAGGALGTLVLTVISVKVLRATDFRGYDSRNGNDLKW